MNKISTLTRAEALDAQEFHRGECQAYHGPRGGWHEEIEVWRRNGMTQVWKTRPADFRVPVKYGMRAYGDIGPANAGEFHLPQHCPLTRVEYRRIRSDGRTIEIVKWGGGTLGKRYSGDWDVNVYDTSGKVLFTDVVHTGTPKTHAEVEEIVLDYTEREVWS